MMRRVFLLFVVLVVSMAVYAEDNKPAWYDNVSWTYPMVNANIPLGHDRYIQASGLMHFHHGNFAEFEMKYTQSGDYVLPKVRLLVTRIADPQPSKIEGLTGFEGSEQHDVMELVFAKDEKYPNIYKGSIIIESFIPNMGTGSCTIMIDSSDQELVKKN